MRDARRGRHKLRHQLRGYAVSERVRMCGSKRVADRIEVAVRRGSDGAAHARYLGLLRCGHVWDCPCCSARILAERTTWLDAVSQSRANDAQAMVTFSIAHYAGNGLAELLGGMARAHRRMLQGKEGQRLFGGLHAWARRTEVTLGDEYGWHPHYHSLLVFDALRFPNDGCTAKDDRDAEKSWESVCACRCPRCTWRVDVTMRWRECVRKELGASHVPSPARAAHVTSGHEVARYISKLALEVAGVSKESRKPGHRTEWQLAEDVARWNHPRDVALWKEYQRAVKGRRMFAFSKSANELLAALGLKVPERAGDHSLDEIGDDDDETIEIRVDEWELVRRARAIDQAACARVLEAAEQQGARGVVEQLRIFRLRLGEVANESTCDRLAWGEMRASPRAAPWPLRT